MDRTANRRCVLLFAVSAAAEARAKRLGRAGLLLAYARRRLAAAVAELPGVDLVAIGSPVAGCRAFPQRGRGFGERLENAFADARALGYRDIVAVPGDVPQLGAAVLARAFALLGSRRTVLGPSPDGGVYLLGCRLSGRSGQPGDINAPRDLLAGIAWRRPSVCAELLSRAGDAALLPPLADLDARRDLAALLAAELPADLARLIARLLPARPATGWAGRGSPPRRLLLAARLATRGPPATAPLR
jgi:glycosyltransferase A (GT-A) superfamily protein (DUF2064 family)